VADDNEFAALAVEKALQALERMLRLAVAPSSRAGMAGLIKQLGQRVSLQPELSEFLTDMVRLRNDWVGHPAERRGLPARDCLRTPPAHPCRHRGSG